MVGDRLYATAVGGSPPPPLERGDLSSHQSPPF
jgi:hypothetical protein